MTQDPSQHAKPEVLDDVQTAVRDAINGYETMSEKAEPSFKRLVEHILEVHRRHDAELVKMRTVDPSADDKADTTSGSWMTTVHQTVITVRSWFDEIDDGLIPEIIDGEERLFKTYRDAMAVAQPRWIVEALTTQSAEIDRLISELRTRGS